MPTGTIFYMIITPLVTVFLIFALRFIIKKLEKTLEKENPFSKLNVEKRQLQDRMEEKKAYDQMLVGQTRCGNNFLILPGKILYYLRGILRTGKTNHEKRIIKQLIIKQMN